MTMQGAHPFVVKNYTLRYMVQAAYNLSPRAVSGGPSWIDVDKYEILAVTPGETRPTLDQQMAMLRTLLSERFHLTFHRDTKDLSIYMLTAAKGGAKLQESKAAADAPSEVINRVFPHRIALPARNATMPEFASMLQRAVFDRPVIDKRASPAATTSTSNGCPTRPSSADS